MVMKNTPYHSRVGEVKEVLMIPDKTHDVERKL